MRDNPKYDNPAKDIAWKAYWSGYKLGYHVESYDESDIKTAESNFERWWKRNHE